MKLGRLLLRVLVGGLFVGHGTQKLLGWFDGPGLEGTAEGFDSMGLKPAKAHAAAAGAAEAFGGAGLVAGYQTPFAAAGTIAVMLTAIKRVHLKNGPWAQQGGYEYNLVLIAAALAVAEAGPGPVSLDALRHKQKQGIFWALTALALGAAGAAAVDQVAGGKSPIPAPEPAAPAAPTVPDPAVEGAAPAPTDIPVVPESPLVETETDPAEELEVDEAAVTDAEVAPEDAAGDTPTA